MAIEKERKFLPNGLMAFTAKARKQIRQGYLMLSEGKQLRVRIVDNTKGIICYKSAVTEDTRNEFEYEIPLADAEALYLEAPIKLEKERFSFDLKENHFDIDYYSNGLVVIEIEFEGELKNVPKWVGRDITGVKEYSNVYIAKQASKKKSESIKPGKSS